ncbi:MAG: Peptidoglycan glycosyltransferase [Parcubacteria group bacterium GW2011_GWA2_33_14]|nr:MAG: Peptidoglycan glycosyltransferase [Parcubacteria group bacterium GW2011_GWA2_33_14]
MIICRLFYIQILNHKLYQSQALGQQTGFWEIQGSRGEVFFKNSKDNDGNYGLGEEKSLAINKEKWVIFAVPKKIKDKNNFAEILSNPLQETKEFIITKLKESESYVVLKKDALLSQVTDLKNLKLEGLSFESTTARYYPQEELASQVIGFVGGNNNGQYGIEGYYDEILAGKQGVKEEKRGLNLLNFENEEMLNGSDLFLTIDYNIQFQAESLLKEAKKNINIDSGQIIVLKPDSGRILALANFPSFNPNKYSKEANFDIFQNSAVQKIFEPGSVFKPFIMAMALNEGKVTEESSFTDTGFVKIGPDTIHNFDRKVYGTQTMSSILEKSINTGAVFLASLLSHETFNEYLEKMGFNEKTGIDLQGEVYSKNEILKKGSSFGFATASFGQGIEMTPLQLARSFALFANGGRIITPHIVEKIVHGQDEMTTKPQASPPVISEKVASSVTKMLINVVERGFGNAARIEGYYLAGKTGTAEVPLLNSKGYYTDKTIQSFIGFGPALKPQFLILVKLDNPKVSKSALSAAPIFKKLSQYIINYWQLPPDY